MTRLVQTLLLLVLLALASQAQAQSRDFDHLRTGFALSGSHVNARCESCHVGGVFKGTPKDCESCHTAGARLARGNAVKTADHLNTQQTCDSCHNTRSFSGARMNHSQVAKGSCASCHNGVQAIGKTPTHVRTSAACDSCHSSQAWRPATGFDHAGVAPGTCGTCHNGVQAMGKGAGHTPYTLVAATASASCDTCHKAGFKAWTPAKLHTNVTVTTQCNSCHASTKPNTPVHVGQTACENCHRSNTTWAGAKVDHGSFTVATNCSSCHNGTAATGKGTTHIPVGVTNCIACHTTTKWTPSSFNHTQTVATSQCASCHTGTFPPADGRGAGHLPYQLITGASSANCDTCHKGSVTTWANGKLHANVSVTGQCKTCHSGSYTSQAAVGKPANHIPESQLLNGAAMECNACHTSTASWGTLRMNHNNSLGGGAGWCKGCHMSGTNFSGGLERKALTHERKTPPAIDCSESGCHRPLGNKGAAYTKWD